MAEFKPAPNISAVPFTCRRCGRHVPVYLLTIKYVTDELSDDRHDGYEEVEVGYGDDTYYCKKCISKMCEQRQFEDKLND